MMPYSLNSANADSWSVEEIDAATRAVTGPFANLDERRAAYLRYEAAMQAKRNSGWQLEPHRRFG